MPNNFRIDFCPSRFRLFKRLEYENGRALTQYHARPPFENGRHVSFDITRSASQPFIVPTVIVASAPPVTAASTIPLRTMRNAGPWQFAEEHALAME